MSTWLVCLGVQTEVQEVSTRIFGGIDVSPSKGVGEVISKESRAVLLEDVNTVSLKLQGINSLGRVGEGQPLASNLRAKLLVLDADGVECNGIISHNISRVSAGLDNALILKPGQSVPIPVAVRVVHRVNIEGWSKTNEHVLNGPLQLRQQDLILVHGQSLGLESVDSNE